MAGRARGSPPDRPSDVRRLAWILRPDPAPDEGERDDRPEATDDVPGVDPLQALQLAILRARRLLDASGLRLTWLDGVPGDVGIPLSVPTGHGFEVQRKMERVLERESKRFTEAVAAFLREKERVRAAKARRKERGA